MIFEYIYNKGKNARRGRQKVGMFLAMPDSRGGFYTSWSLCNTKAGDKFDRWLALMECNKRLGKVDETIPESLRSSYENFQERAGKYYKEQKRRTTKSK